MLSPLQFTSLPLRDSVEGLHIDSICPEHRVIDDPHSATRDRADAELLMAWQTQLSHDEDIERGIERDCNLERHRHAAPRQAKNEQVAPRGVAGGENGRQLPARIRTVDEAFRHISRL